MSTTSTKGFDAHFPSDCPPATADEANGTMYRLVSRETPEGADFRSHAELGLAQTAEPCDRCGLSVYGNQTDAVAQYIRIVDRFGIEGTRIGRFVARLALTHDHGRLLSTSNKRFRDSHHTWWPYSNANRLSSFDQIVEDAGNALES